MSSRQSGLRGRRGVISEPVKFDGRKKPDHVTTHQSVHEDGLGSDSGPGSSPASRGSTYGKYSSHNDRSPGRIRTSKSNPKQEFRDQERYPVSAGTRIRENKPNQRYDTQQRNVFTDRDPRESSSSGIIKRRDGRERGDRVRSFGSYPGSSRQDYSQSSWSQKPGITSPRSNGVHGDSLDGRFGDDSRLSKLLRKLSREDERDRKLLTARQVKEFIFHPDNTKMILKSTDHVLDSLLDAFYERASRDLKQELAESIGHVGSIMSHDAQRYVDWIFDQVGDVSSDETKIFLLTALLETLREDERRKNMGDLMQLVMTSSQAVLANADLPELLIAVVDIILLVIKDYPEVFSSYFGDTVDILVGWHIDSTQKTDLTSYTSEALIAFHQFWVADMRFSVTLLGQFVEDMEAYTEDLSLGMSGQALPDDDLPTPEECITKLAALIRVFTTVVRSVDEYLKPDTEYISLDYLGQTVSRIAKCVETAVETMFDERIYIAANDCMRYLLKGFSGHMPDVCNILLTYVEKQQKMTRPLSNTYIASLLTLLQKLVAEASTQMPVTFITMILAPDSLLTRIRFAHSRKILAQLMSLYHAILVLKNVPLLEEAYRHVVGDLEVAFNTLLESTESDFQCSLVTNSPYKMVVYTPKQAEAIVIFNVCALAEIGNIKNNLIAMLALSPGIFELFAVRLIPGHHSVMVCYPAVHYALLHALYSHCSRHNHFIASSQLSQQNTTLEGGVVTNVGSSTSGHFHALLGMLAELLSEQNVPYDSMALVLRWAGQIIEAVHSTPNIYAASDFVSMSNAIIELGMSSEGEIDRLVCECLHSLFTHGVSHPESQQENCIQLCTVKLATQNSQIRTMYQRLLCLMPAHLTLGCTSNQQQEVSGQDKSSTNALRLARKSHMAKVPLATFHTHNFKAIMGYILFGTQPGGLVETEWLDRLYHTCQKLEKDDNKQQLKPLLNKLDSHRNQLWFWATWEAAQFCILSKLRTPLGKPLDTFTTIETALKKYTTDVRGRDSDDIRHETTKKKKVPTATLR